MSKPIGHCHCGAVRYAFDRSTVFDPDICHCDDCRRSTGAPFVASFAVPDTGWRWTAEEPRVYHSSPGVRRWFCGTCGTSLAYATEERPDETHLNTATLVSPDDIPPESQAHASERIGWIDTALDLPAKS